MSTRGRVVIVGAGFGGLTAARALARAPLDIVLVDRTNHHLFQPLLYQVAMAGLSPADIAWPIRATCRGQKNLSVLLAEVKGIDLQRRVVRLDDREIAYDQLVLAAGAQTDFFGRRDLQEHALGLKDLADALAIRERMLLSFEAAELALDDESRSKYLTFVVIGGGPTGVELAGAIAELARTTLARDFRAIDPTRTRVLLLEGGARILAAFPEDLSHSAERQLAELGVEVRTGAMVEHVGDGEVRAGGDVIRAHTVLWAAGVRAAGLAETIPAERDGSGRLLVAADCSLPGHPEVFVIGDMAAMFDARDKPLPGIAPVAMQQGEHVARCLRDDIAGRARRAFIYKDNGIMATIGRSRAVAQIRGHKLRGAIAWVCWLTIHLIFLMGFRNRIVVFLSWTYSYLTWGRGARLVVDAKTGDRPYVA